ncbi:MAG: hypothetical protein ACJAZ1_002434 [Yoonia sp.]|jgi:hypothetical protein
MFARYFKAFGKDESGTISIELLIVVPMLTWALISVIVYFDAFRAQYYSERANDTIADMISREENAITAEFLEGADGVLRNLTTIDSSPEFRVTIVGYTEADDSYRIIWSRGEGAGIDLDNVVAPILDVSSLPQLADGDHVILLTTRVDYSAPLDPGFGFFSGTGLSARVFERTTVVAPRNVVLVCWDEDADNNANPLVC